MSETSGFFNAQLVDSEPDRVYEASDFAGYYGSLISNGVFVNPTTNLQVMAPSSGLSVNLKAGRAFINGYWYKLDEDVSLPLQAAPSSGTRYDAVVVELNLSTRVITYKLITGLSTGSMPAASALTRTANVYQLCLAVIRVASGTTNITADLIYDKRPDNDFCGWVAGIVKQIDTTDLFAQFTAAFEEWFESVEDLIDEVTAASLQLQINAIIATLEQGLSNLKEINNGVTIRFWFGTSDQYEALKSAGELLDNVLYVRIDDTSAEDIRNQLEDLAANKAAKNHASETTEYGIATGSNYGHVKLCSNLTTYYSRTGNGVALDGALGYTIGQKFNKLEAVATDSGWSNITSVGTNWTIGSGGLQIRKIGNHVFVRGNLVAGSSSPSSQAFSVPQAYRPIKTSYALIPTDSSSTQIQLSVNTSGQVIINADMSSLTLITARVVFDYFVD